MCLSVYVSVCLSVCLSFSETLNTNEQRNVNCALRHTRNMCLGIYAYVRVKKRERKGGRERREKRERRKGRKRETYSDLPLWPCVQIPSQKRWISFKWKNGVRSRLQIDFRCFETVFLESDNRKLLIKINRYKSTHSLCSFHQTFLKNYFNEKESA